MSHLSWGRGNNQESLFSMVFTLLWSSLMIPSVLMSLRNAWFAGVGFGTVLRGSAKGGGLLPPAAGDVVGSVPLPQRTCCYPLRHRGRGYWAQARFPLNRSPPPLLSRSLLCFDPFDFRSRNRAQFRFYLTVPGGVVYQHPDAMGVLFIDRCDPPSPFAFRP